MKKLPVLIGLFIFNASAEVWKPALNTSWQWQLQGTIDTTVQAQMYDIDLFDAPAAKITTLKNQGRKLVCYMSAGSYENWRPDASKFPAAVLGRNLDGWAGERWLDIRRLDILGPIMQARMDLCKSKGFDAVEPDNIDGYTNTTGFPLTYQDQIRYNTFLANAAHARGLSIALKNDLEQIKDLLPLFDFAINESCFDYAECSYLTPFVVAGKAVFQAQYNKDPATFCPKANNLNFNSMKKRMDLGVWRYPCR